MLWMIPGCSRAVMSRIGIEYLGAPASVASDGASGSDMVASLKEKLQLCCCDPLKCIGYKAKEMS